MFTIYWILWHVILEPPICELATPAKDCQQNNMKHCAGEWITSCQWIRLRGCTKMHDREAKQVSKSVLHITTGHWKRNMVPRDMRKRHAGAGKRKSRRNGKYENCLKHNAGAPKTRGTIIHIGACHIHICLKYMYVSAHLSISVSLSLSTYIHTHTYKNKYNKTTYVLYWAGIIYITFAFETKHWRSTCKHAYKCNMCFCVCFCVAGFVFGLQPNMIKK